ncbi:MAG TPA: ATP-binding protein, partial [Opitutales bacterium]|nr:ATP-binding protein [Opitutales bacterium]
MAAPLDISAKTDQMTIEILSHLSREIESPLTQIRESFEASLADRDHTLTLAHRDRLEAAHRPLLHLLRLANSLQEFSQLKSGQLQPTFAPTELAGLTTQLANNFRSVCEQAGLAFQVDCVPSSEEIYVDQQLWEKIVSHLISNAFKFTFSGKIHVCLRSARQQAELKIADTGIGISRSDTPNLFQKFHRVRDARARSTEGLGLGLALVHELVKLHGGTITCESTLGAGSTFTVVLPAGSRHLPKRHQKLTALPPTLTAAPNLHVEEAWRWVSPPVSFKPPENSSEDGEHLFRRLADTIPTMVWISGPTKKRTWFNKRWIDFVGHTIEELLGDGWSENVHPDDLHRYIQVCTAAYEAGAPFSMEYRLKRHDGIYRWLLVNGAPFRDSNGAVAGYIGSCMDITQQKSQEAALKEADVHKNEFLAMLAHELRNPLAPIRSAVEILNQQASTDPLLQN